MTETPAAVELLVVGTVAGAGRAARAVASEVGAQTVEGVSGAAA